MDETLRWVIGGLAAAILAWQGVLSALFIGLLREMRTVPNRDEIVQMFNIHSATPHEGAVRIADYQLDRHEIRERLERIERNQIKLLVAMSVPPTNGDD